MWDLDFFATGSISRKCGIYIKIHYQLRQKAGSSPRHGQGEPGFGLVGEGEGVGRGGGGGVGGMVGVGVPWGGCVKPGHGV